MYSKFLLNYPFKDLDDHTTSQIHHKVTFFFFLAHLIKFSIFQSFSYNEMVFLKYLVFITFLNFFVSFMNISICLFYFILSSNKCLCSSIVNWLLFILFIFFSLFLSKSIFLFISCRLFFKIC